LTVKVLSFRLIPN